MEGCEAIILQDDRGVIKNEKYDNTQPESWKNMRFFCSLDWAYFFGKTPVEIIVKEALSDRVEYRGTLSYDRMSTFKLGYSYSFLPLEVSVDTFITWVKENRRATILTAKPVLIESL